MKRLSDNTLCWILAFAIAAFGFAAALAIDKVVSLGQQVVSERAQESEGER